MTLAHDDYKSRRVSELDSEPTISSKQTRRNSDTFGRDRGNILPFPPISEMESPPAELYVPPALDAQRDGEGFEYFAAGGKNRRRGATRYQHMTQPADLGTVEAEASIEFSASIGLHIDKRTNHIRPISLSACGLKVDLGVWNGKNKHVATSTIGGLIRLNGANYGITTAHSVFELVPTSGRTELHAGQEGTPDQSAFMSALRYCSATSRTWPGLTLYIRALGYGDLYMWLQSVWSSSMGKGMPTSISDFALVEISSTTITPSNSYQTTPTGSQLLPYKCFVEHISYDLHQGDVLILLSPNEPLSGFLLETSALFIDGSNVFHTKKIYTKEKLSMRADIK
jgi:hypothetical protein